MKQLQEDIKNGSFRALAKGITIVENELEGYEALMAGVDDKPALPLIGVTGPPGAGKSTLVNALLGLWLSRGKKVAVIAVDPSSPFNYGALLGDRIRMTDFYANPNVFIRSLASRGALGGLSAKIIEITSLVKGGNFDIVVVETVGVGQSEVEIAGLADCTIVALVPEAGDEVQTLKAGIMEIADVFVVNKADRENAEGLYRNLRMMAHEKARGDDEIPVLKTIASTGEGIAALADEIDTFLAKKTTMPAKRLELLTEKSWQLIEAQRMKIFSHDLMKAKLRQALEEGAFNLYSFTRDFMTETLQEAGK